ncbi:steroidogenic acute regulatory protein, mitochondrial-like [Sinocyclocheilus anshuiensis]|uniref:steroidogenic acute regulatory protein, mitochondrial-like n=1 Tax=Sinocyclocheilus anshuiensis TaxID=1608454 RepID=UPI0007BA293D|nr:PREDICTED: steroidogenic acute regulatory protein, mitochondrial-like [Sinocyclocheilus anshuiensis]
MRPYCLQRAALAAFGQEITHLQSRGQMVLPAWIPLRWTETSSIKTSRFIPQVLKHVGRNAMVTHDVSVEMAGNLIGQRDFLNVRYSSKSESRVYFGGAATWMESLPPQPGFVRAEDGPTCIILQSLQDRPDRSRFIWLLNMDIRGWLPQSLVNKALPQAQVDFTKHLRRRLATQHPENKS